MDAYTSFATVYDELMDNIPYEEWSRYLIDLLKDKEVEHGLILDLGCGTGTITRYLAEAGYDMIGIDNSVDMLQIAREKSDGNILYLLQDMREFELYGTVAGVVSVCDSMNYLLEEEDFIETIRLVNNYLDPSGVFIFDLNTEYKYEYLLGDHTIAEDREEVSFIWDNYYDKKTGQNEYNLSLFVKEDELYRKYQETHYQKAYSLNQVKAMVEAGGMEYIAAYDAFTKAKPHDKSERIYVIAREKPTKNKVYKTQEQEG